MAWSRMVVGCVLVVLGVFVFACLPSGVATAALMLAKDNLFHLLRVLLWDLYFHGLGFWRGQEPASICAQLTGVPEAHWRDHAMECRTRLDTQFQGFVVGLGTPLLVFLLYRATVSLGWYFFVFQPMVAALGNHGPRRHTSPTRELLHRLLARLTPRNSNKHNNDGYLVADASTPQARH